MFNFSSRQSQGPAGARGYRAYVVGDVHGRVDLLEHLLAKIHAELQRRPAKKVLLVFVGDLIDRGPSSAQVIERLRCYRRERVKSVFLLGNHEEVLLRILRGDSSVVNSWLKFGGLQCLQSYGVALARIRGRSAEQVVELVRATIPQEHVDFLETFADSCRFGDYLFVHAGVRPGVDVDQQSQSDLRWIRDPFLFDESDHGFIVVHGHTITDEVDERANRIAIDTGAYRSGVLTALAVEGRERWLIDTRGRPGSNVSD